MGKATFFTGQPVFNQLLSLIPRAQIERLSKQHGANRYCKRFMAYDHLITMLYGAFFNATNLREITTGLQAFGPNKLNHLGLLHPPKRSTLSEANQRRSAKFFEGVYHMLYETYFGLPDSRRPFNIDDDIFIIDSTTFSLFNSVMRGAGTSKQNGKKKGGVKAHMMIDAKHDLPAFVFISEAKEHDLIFLHQLKVPDNSTVIFDKAYINYTQFKQWNSRGIRWVSRLKRDASVRVLVNLPLAETSYDLGVRSDKYVQLGRPSNKKKIPLTKARIVEFWDPEKQRTFEFICNDYTSPAEVIADLYKRRWQIETLFKRIKQRYPLKYFLGDNPNAIEIQIWATLICDLLVRIIQKTVNENGRKHWAYSTISGMIRQHLMNYFNIVAFLINPEKTLRNYIPPSNQLTLNFQGASP
jgi:hypothetical protein